MNAWKFSTTDSAKRSNAYLCVRARAYPRTLARTSQPAIITGSFCAWRGASASSCSPFPCAKHALRMGEGPTKNVAEPNGHPAFRNKPPTNAGQKCAPGTRRVVDARCTFKNVRNRLFANRSMNILRKVSFRGHSCSCTPCVDRFSIRWRADPPPLYIPVFPSFCSGYDEADRCALQAKIGRTRERIHLYRISEFGRQVT